MKRHEIFATISELVNKHGDDELAFEIIEFIYQETKKLEDENRKLRKELNALKNSESSLVKENRSLKEDNEIQQLILDMQHEVILFLISEGEK